MLRSPPILHVIGLHTVKRSGTTRYVHLFTYTQLVQEQLQCWRFFGELLGCDHATKQQTR